MHWAFGRANNPGGERLLALAPLDLGRGDAVEVGLPDHHHLVRAARREEMPVRGEARAVDGAGVALQGEEQAPLAQVPDLQRAVLRRRQHVVAGLDEMRVKEWAIRRDVRHAKMMAMLAYDMISKTCHVTALSHTFPSHITPKTYRVHGDGGDLLVVRGVVLDEEVGADVPHLERAVRAA